MKRKTSVTGNYEKKKTFTSSDSQDNESHDDDVVEKLSKKKKPLQLTYTKPFLKATSMSRVMRNIDYYEKNKSDSDIEMEEVIDEYQKSNNSDSLKDRSDNFWGKNIIRNTSQETTGKNYFHVWNIII